MGDTKWSRFKHNIVSIMRPSSTTGDRALLIGKGARSDKQRQDRKPGKADFVDHQDGKGGSENVAYGSLTLEELNNNIQRLSCYASNLFNYGALEGSIHPIDSDGKAWRHKSTWTGIETQESQSLELPVQPPHPSFGELLD